MGNRKLRTFAALALSLGLLVALAGVAGASLQTTNILRSWDDGLNRYENGNLTMNLNNNLQPFYTQLAFDNKQHANACGAGTRSIWAGDATIGLYHTDNNPAGAPGFQGTKDWSIVKCSTFTANKYPAAADILTTCVAGAPGDPNDGGCVLIGTPDLSVPCTTGNCTDEIQTQFHVNTDLDCNGTQDTKFATAGDLCLYWGGVKPPPTTPVWGGNIQVRYGTGVGGDKTINFNQLLGPTAVGLRSFAGASTLSVLPIGLAAAILGFAGLIIVRRSLR